VRPCLDGLHIPVKSMQLVLKADVYISPGSRFLENVCNPLHTAHRPFQPSIASHRPRRHTRIRFEVTEASAVETTDGLNMASNTRSVQVPTQMSHSHNAQRDHYMQGLSHINDSSVLHSTKKITSHSNHLVLEF
jgi:hypothetical protein